MTDSSRKSLTFTIYILYIAGVFSVGILALIALILNYAKRSDMQGTLFESHFNWQIRTVWFYLLWNILSVVAFVSCCIVDATGSLNIDITQGFSASTFGLIQLIVVLTGSWVWIVYRAIKGLLRLNENKPVI